MPEKEKTRKALAEFLRVTPEEIVITRNTSESNNLVSNGLDLKAGDEVLISRRQPSEQPQGVAREGQALRLHGGHRRAEEPAPGRGLLHRRVHEGDHAAHEGARLHAPIEHGRRPVAGQGALPLAAQRGVLSLLDGAQSFGLLDVNLADIQPDFYSGSAHKWPCGARECGVLFVNKRAHDKLWPSIYSAYPGAVGISRTFEGFGQRDEATMIAFREALAFQTKVGRAAIEQRSRGARARS